MVDKLDLVIFSIYAVGFFISILASSTTEYIYEKAKKIELTRKTGEISFLAIARSFHYSVRLFGFCYLLAGTFLLWQLK